MQIFTVAADDLIPENVASATAVQLFCALVFKFFSHQMSESSLSSVHGNCCGSNLRQFEDVVSHPGKLNRDLFSSKLKMGDEMDSTSDQVQLPQIEATAILSHHSLQIVTAKSTFNSTHLPALKAYKNWGHMSNM